MKTDTTMSWADELCPIEKSPIRKREIIPDKKKESKPSIKEVEKENVKKGYTFVNGLLYLEPTTLLPHGEIGSCTYNYYTGPEEMEVVINKLKYIANNNQIFAIDFETGPAKKSPVDLYTGEFELNKLDYIPGAGSDPHSSEVFLMSVSTQKNHAWVIDVREARKYPEFLIQLGRVAVEGKLIAHNALFELCYIIALTGVLGKVYFDPMVSSQVLYAGLPDPNQPWVNATKPPRVLVSLGNVLERELGIKLNKSEQKKFLSLHKYTGLTNNQIAYAAGDTGLLLQLTEILLDKLNKQGLLHIWNDIESKFLPVLAENSYYGCPIDIKTTVEYRNECQKLIDALELQWCSLETGISITSPDQILEYFQNKYPNKDIKSTDNPVLSSLFVLDKEGKFVSGDKASFLILEHRGISKVKGTYLDAWITKSRNCFTGNIHCSIQQAYTTTSRLSYREPNLENIPSNGLWKKIRKCVKAPKGYLLVDRDLSQFEVRALADMANETKMMAFFIKADKVENEIIKYLEANNKETEEISKLIGFKNVVIDEIIESLSKNSAIIKEKYVKLNKLVEELQACDFHTLNALAIFGDKFANGNPEERIELRKRAKVLTFAIPYGSGPSKIAKTFKISKEEAQGLIDLYNSTWPNIAKFLSSTAKSTWEKGYTICPTGRKRFFTIGKHFTDDEKWQLKSSHEREGKNHPIQCVNAETLKVASILIQPFLKEYESRIVLWVHDEILILSPEKYAYIVSKKLDECMKQAAKICGLNKVIVKTSGEVSEIWSH